MSSFSRPGSRSASADRGASPSGGRGSTCAVRLPTRTSCRGTPPAPAWPDVRRTIFRCRPCRGLFRYRRASPANGLLAQPSTSPPASRTVTKSAEDSDQVVARQWDCSVTNPEWPVDQPRYVATAAHGSSSRPTSVRHSCRNARPTSVTTYAGRGGSAWPGGSCGSAGPEAMGPSAYVERTYGARAGLPHEVGLLARHFAQRHDPALIVGQVGQRGVTKWASGLPGWSLTKPPTPSRTWSLVD